MILWLTFDGIKFNIILERRCRALISLGWTFAFLFSTPMLFNYQLVQQQDMGGSVQCWMYLPEEWMWKVSDVIETLRH